MLSITRLRKYSYDYHKICAWIGGFALLTFAISAFMHVLMVWTGPKAVTFFPPKMQVNGQLIEKIPAILNKHHIHQWLLVKAVQGENGAVLQVTTDKTSPKRYFDFATGLPIPDGDLKQAKFLATHYSGLPQDKITDITLQTEFDNAYPWVNRLLPVYKITYDDPHITFYVHTETGANAGVTNAYKTFIQAIFKNFHTLSFLDDLPFGRIVIMLLLLGAILAMLKTGIVLIYAMKKRPIIEKKRRYHRLLANIIWLPLLFFTASGLWHLLQFEYGTNPRGMRLFDIATKESHTEFPKSDIYTDFMANSISLVKYQNQFYYRLAPAMQHKGKVTSKQRFDGIPTEKTPLYLDADTGQKADITDQHITRFYAESFMNAKVIDSKKITHFGMHYDFRNKRLPVYELKMDTPKGDILFIDPATGIMVDRLTDPARYEGYAFSFAHKWNMFVPLMGRDNRDILIAIMLFAFISMTILGIMMKLKKKRQRES